MGAKALDEVASSPGAYLPLLVEVVGNRGLTLQMAHRLPIAFERIGKNAIEPLLDLMRSGNWTQMGSASVCLAKLPEAAQSVSTLVEPDAGSLDRSRRAIEALGQMGAADYRFQIMDAALEHDEYAFEKLGFYAFCAFAMMLAQNTEDPDIQDLMYKIEMLIHSSVGDERFARGYNPNRAWRKSTERVTPEAENALQAWLQHTDPTLATYALIAFSQSRNPWLLSPMLSLVETRRGFEQERLVSLYLGAQDSSEAASKILQAWRQSEGGATWVYLEALSWMMHRVGDDLPVDIFGLDPHTVLQAAYTKGPYAGAADFAEGSLDASSDFDRGAAAIVIAMNRAVKAAEAIEKRARFASSPIESVLLQSACVRCDVKGSHDRLHEKLAAITQPLRDLPFLWRRELVYAVSTAPADGPERGKAWGELFNIDLGDAISEIGRFAPIA